MSRWHLAPRLAAVVSLAAALLLPTAAAQAAENTDPATAAPIRTISYNVCGAAHDCQSALSLADWGTAVTGQVGVWDADAVMLQELCAGQFNQLSTRLTGYTGMFTRTLTAGADSNGPRCSKWDAADAGYGIGLFIKTTAALDTYAAALQVPAGNEPRSVQCARVPIDGRTTLVCNTHLADYIDRDTTRPTVHQLGVNDNGTGQVLKLIDTWAGGLPIMIGGDFNANPTEGILAPFMAGTPGTGAFADVDENDPTPGGEPTTVLTAEKIDYVFVTAPDYYSVSAAVVDPGLSDHKLLRGATYAEKRPASGVPGDLTNDGRPDLVAVKDDGTLRLYAGYGDGRIGRYRQIGNSGWTNALISHRGDWTGDGREDLIAKIGDNLWIYPNTGYGELGTRIPMGGRPTGWSASTAVLAVGDFTGDGHPDLISRDTNGLWLYPGDPANPSGLSTAAPIRIGTTGWTDFDLLAPGDATGDGRPDLWARDRATGNLLQYANVGGTALASGTTLSAGAWTTTVRPLLGTAGDADHDGHPDLWASASDTTLQYYAGTGTSPAFAAPTGVGNGGWQWILRLA